MTDRAAEPLTPYLQHVTAVGRLLRSRHGEPRVLERLAIPPDGRPVIYLCQQLDSR